MNCYIRILKQVDEGLKTSFPLFVPLFLKHVLVVEDIVDSGRTLRYLVELLKTREPASLKICTLLDKPDRRIADVHVDYVGFPIPDEFVVGYGLDFDELYRNIPFIAVLKPEAFGGVDPE